MGTMCKFYLGLFGMKNIMTRAFTYITFLIEIIVLFLFLFLFLFFLFFPFLFLFLLFFLLPFLLFDGLSRYIHINSAYNISCARLQYIYIYTRHPLEKGKRISPVLHLILPQCSAQPSRASNHGSSLFWAEYRWGCAFRLERCRPPSC